MEIMPSEYQHIELSRDEKIFVRNILSNERFGFLLLNVNPAMLSNESMHVLLFADGILFLKFLEGMTDEAQFATLMPFLIDSVYKQSADIISAKLLSNQALVDKSGKIKFPFNIVYVFPAFSRTSFQNAGDEKLQAFVANSCLFKDDLFKFRSSFDGAVFRLLQHPISKCSEQRMTINDNNVNSILQRIAPEYVTIRVSNVVDAETKAGADNELLVVTDNDVAVKAFRLDDEQINIINKISKGDQLILACAGSGKSVLLIAKCFKAAEMNPDKQFLITCRNRNLYYLYTWFIDRAGLKAKNVTCLTFEALSRHLLVNNGIPIAGIDFTQYVNYAISNFNKGRIKDRFYGIFIDEVQQFDQEWYKFCFNLLENKSSDDHIFVICGDKTQRLAKLQKQGRAPWNAGEGYPNYRGGNKNIRIERNYRNCIEINEYINRFVSHAKRYLYEIQSDAELDPDMFLRGKSVFHGPGVTIKQLKDKSNMGEAKAVYESIVKIHDEQGIPYDEIAVIMFNSSYKKRFAGWADYPYNLEGSLSEILNSKDITFCRMYKHDMVWGAKFGESEGVKFIKIESALGLDFRAAVFCGLLPFGEYNKTKLPDWEILRVNEESFQEHLKNAQDDIRFLYVACTRAKEILHIILPETAETSVYVKMLTAAQQSDS